MLNKFHWIGDLNTTKYFHSVPKAQSSHPLPHFLNYDPTVINHMFLKGEFSLIKYTQAWLMADLLN